MTGREEEGSWLAVEGGGVITTVIVARSHVERLQCHPHSGTFDATNTNHSLITYHNSLAHILTKQEHVGYAFTQYSKRDLKKRKGN